MLAACCVALYAFCMLCLLVQTLEMPADVLAVAFRPDGKQICCACLNGTLQVLQPLPSLLQLQSSALCWCLFCEYNSCKRM
jgi:hypothetical protein